MRLLRTLPLLCAAVMAQAHPGGGIVALDDNSVIAGDPAGNGLWLYKKGQEPIMILKHFHCHWTTRGLDGKLYVEAMQESGGAHASAVFALDNLSKLSQIVDRADLKALVFAVDKAGELVFQRGQQIVRRSKDGSIHTFGQAPALGVANALAWGPNGSLFIGDGNNVRRLEPGGTEKTIAKIEGKMLPVSFYRSPSPLVWGLAVDDRDRAYAAVPELGQVIRIDPDGTKTVVSSSTGGWRVTGVASLGTSLFLLESNDSNYDGPRVRVIRDSVAVELIGLAKAPGTAAYRFGLNRMPLKVVQQ